MTNRFRNSSPEALTLRQAIEKKRAAEYRRQVDQARQLAQQGRGEDTEIATSHAANWSCRAHSKIPKYSPPCNALLPLTTFRSRCSALATR